MFEEAPYFPYDYITSVVISLNPYIWKIVVDPRVDALRNKQKLTKKQESKLDFIAYTYYAASVSLLVYVTYLTMN